MSVELRALGGLLFALLVAVGVWWFVRGRGRGGRPAAVPSPYVPGPNSGDISARAGAAPHDVRNADDDPDDGFDYAPELRLPVAVSGDGEAFQQNLEWQHLRHEMASLQTRFDEQNRIIETLQAEIRGLREQLAGGGPQRSVSPEYDEALVYARQGLGAAAIAERCGITLAEAELVRAMAAQ